MIKYSHCKLNELILKKRERLNKEENGNILLRRTRYSVLFDNVINNFIMLEVENIS